MGSTLLKENDFYAIYPSIAIAIPIAIAGGSIVNAFIVFLLVVGGKCTREGREKKRKKVSQWFSGQLVNLVSGRRQIHHKTS